MNIAFNLSYFSRLGHFCQDIVRRRKDKTQEIGARGVSQCHKEYSLTLRTLIDLNCSATGDIGMTKVWSNSNRIVHKDRSFRVPPA